MGYLPLFERDEDGYRGKVQCLKFSRTAEQAGENAAEFDVGGSPVRLDWFHFYFSLYHKPYNNPSEFLQQHRDSWESRCSSLGIPAILPDGGNARCSVGASWCVLAVVSGARTIRPEAMARFMRVAASLWLSCKFSGDIASDRGAIVVQDGRVDAHAFVSRFFSDRSVRDDIISKLVSNFRETSQMPLSVLLLMLGRWCRLVNHSDGVEITLGFERTLIGIMENCLGMGKVYLQGEMPLNGIDRYLYRGGKSLTNSDPHARMASLSKESDNATKARRACDYEHHNVLYLGKSTPDLTLGLRHAKAMSIVADEVGFKNTKTLQVFSSVYLAKDVTFGVALPPQLMPAMAVDLVTKTIGARIITNFGNPPASQGGRGRGRRGGRGGHAGRGGGRGGGLGSMNRTRRSSVSTTVKADPLVTTWHICIGLDNAIRSVTEDGLLTFHARGLRVHPLTRGKPGRVE